MSNEEMISTIQCFIHHKTNRQIRILKPKTPSQFLLLTSLYQKCIGFFIKH